VAKHLFELIAGRLNRTDRHLLNILKARAKKETDRN